MYITLIFYILEQSSTVARPNGQLRQAGVARGIRGHAPPHREILEIFSRKYDLQRFLRFQYKYGENFGYIYIYFLTVIFWPRNLF